MSATGGKYSVGGKDFSLALVDGIPQADYTVTNSVATTLDKVTYSFSVDSKPVEVVIKNDAISSVTVDSKQVGTKAGTYSVGEKSLKVSYSGGNLTAETAAPVSTSIISSVATYQVGDTKVTVTDGKLSTSTAKVNGHNAKLTYSADTKKITATYSVTTTSTTTTGDPNTYNITLPDNSTVKVKLNGESISSVTKSDGTTIPQEGVYYTVTNGKNTYKLELVYSNNKLTATALATTTIEASESAEIYTVKVGSGDSAPSTKITVKDNKLYQDASTDALTATNDGVYSVKVGTTEVKLTYNTTDGLQEYVDVTNAKDLSTLTEDYTAKDGEILTGTLREGLKVIIPAGATVTLYNVTIDISSATGEDRKPGIECVGTATINLVGTNNVKGAQACAGIQAGGQGTTLTIKGSGSLTATGGYGGAGIGAGFNGTCGNIKITGGTITATGGKYGAGIGAGNMNSTCGNIEITGGTVKANGGEGGAGIGSGLRPVSMNSVDFLNRGVER